MKDVSKTLSIAAVIAMVSAAGVTIAQTTSDSLPNSNSPNAASAPEARPSTDNNPQNSALPTNEGTSSATPGGAAATPTLEQRQEGSGSMGSRNTPDVGTTSSTDSSSSTSSTMDSSSSSELPARADRG